MLDPTVTFVVIALIALGIFLYMDWRRRKHLRWMREQARILDEKGRLE